MIVKHCGINYECDVAAKCTSDNYIKLYKDGKEIAAFYNITDFTDFEISGGSFVAPCSGGNPILLTTYVVKGCTITAADWQTAADGRFYYEIENALISGNETTCNIMLFFAEGTNLVYDGEQHDGKIILYTTAAPLADVAIDSVQITRV